MPTAYQEFVKRHIGSCDGDQKQKMVQVAKMWNEHKMKGVGVAHLKGGQRRNHAYSVADSAAADVAPVKRTAAALAGGRVRGSNPLTAANQLSGAGVGGNFLDIIGFPEDGYDNPALSFLHGVAAAPIVVGKIATGPVDFVKNLFK